MPLYNFTSDGDIFQYANLIRTIDGPAAITPREEADYFTLSYLGGSDIFYWDTNTFQIDGVNFEGTFAEFCTAAEALFASEGGGGTGESWADITDNTIVEIASTKNLSITDSDAVSLVYAGAGAGNRYVGIGDTAAAIEEGPSGSIYVDVTSGAGTASASMDAWHDNYTTYAANGVFIAAGLAEVAIVASNPSKTAGLNLNSSGVVLTGVVAYADNAAAVTAGLPIGAVYRTGDALKIVHS